MSASNSNFKWWQTAVVYQIYPRSFKDSSGDGIGDLQGIIDKLDYLNDGTPDSTGIDAIWISPIYPSPMADFGYDVSDYKNIHPMFGDLETFDRLIAEAHQRGIRIILDYVPNHTSDEHPWFIESRSSRDNAKSDWYIWRDAKPDGSPPNNWTSMFGGRGWTWDENRKQYYLHLFLDKQPDLNWRNPDVQEAMLEVLRFWLDRGVDGFRMDVISYLMKNPDLPDNPLLPEIDTRHLPANDLWYRQKHEHDIDQPEIHDILRRIRHLFDEYEDRVTIGEVIGTDSRERWAKYYGQNLDELHLPFNFDLMHKPWNAAVMRASVEKLESVLPPGATPNYVLGNHDVSRFASRFGEQAVRTAGMLLLTLRGVPTIYMGEELGMVDGKILPEQMQDPQGFNLGVEKTRDVCRTPFQWSDAPFAGFSEVEPWLPIAEGYQTCNVEHQRHDPRSVFSLYRKLIHLRKAVPALNRGVFQAVDTGNDNCFVYRREYAGENYLIALNFSGTPQNLYIDGPAAAGQIVISTEMDREESVSLSEISLRANEGILIKII